jgi:DNA-binding NarL/FixJ family response regulator
LRRTLSVVGTNPGTYEVMTPQGTPRILVVDDHPLTRDALVALLGQNGFDVVGQAADAETAIARAGALTPDLVLLDLSLPGINGLEALPQLRVAAPAAEVVVLTASGTEENLLGAIRGGAAGYLLKSEPPERIVEFLRGVARGEAALSGSIARRLLETVRETGGRETGVPDSVAAELTAREVEILLLLEDRLETDEIAKRLFISEHTVRSHVKNILRKLDVSSRREAVEKLAAARG